MIRIQMGISCLLAGLLLWDVAAAQVTSGVPGDGVPDFYYFPSDGLTAQTSLGPITRRAGVMTVDTDGVGFAATLVGGPLPTCLLCDGEQLPSPDGSASTWSTGFVASGLQFIRTSPLSGPGFQGVVGTGFLDSDGVAQPWPADVLPFANYPEEGIVEFAPGMSMDEFGLVSWGGGMGGGGTTFVTVVPEPNFGWCLFCAVASSLWWSRSRQTR
jgi:hypothetical protein